jgi:hypothetical protein
MIWFSPESNLGNRYTDDGYVPNNHISNDPIALFIGKVEEAFDLSKDNEAPLDVKSFSGKGHATWEELVRRPGQLHNS